MADAVPDNPNPLPDPDTVRCEATSDRTAAGIRPPDTVVNPSPTSGAADNSSPSDEQITRLKHPPADPSLSAGPENASVPEVDRTLPFSSIPAGSAAKDSRPSSDLVRTFGDYELLHPIARGGMGVVYKALQKKLHRVVALKMILTGDMASAQEIERFHLEAEAAAQLDHPGIVPIFEVGELDGQHFFSMGYVEGGSLAGRLRDGPLAPREAAELIQQVAGAVAYAHGQGIIHRDLKPGNVLLDKHGHPRVTDFGLAKRVSGATHLTTAGQVLGTPSYMPPEQAVGNTENVGPSADVYSLGAVLYCVVTGRPPFQAANPVETLRQVLEQEPVSPRQLNPAVGRDLETICLKCLQKDPGKRYGSATAFAEDLRRFLAGEPIQARPVGRAERLWRWCRRNPVVASLAAGIVLSLLAGMAVSLYFLYQARHEAEVARDNERQAREARLLSDHRWYAAEINLAQRDWQEALIAPLLRRLDGLVPADAEAPDLRGFEWYYLKRLSRLDLDTLRDHTGPVRAVAYSPDGRWLVSAAGAGTGPGEIKVRDAASGREVRTLGGYSGLVRSVAFRPDGRELATAGEDAGRVGEIKLWDPATGDLLRTLTGSSPGGWNGTFSRIVYSPDGRWLALGNGWFGQNGTAAPGEVLVWDLASGKRVLSVRYPSGPVLNVAFSPRGPWLAASGMDGKVAIWDVRKGEQVLTLDAHPTGDDNQASVTALAFDRAGERFATGSSDRTVKVWDTKTWTEAGIQRPALIHTLRHDGSVNSVAFSDPDGRWLAVGTEDRRVTVWSIAGGHEILQLQGHGGAVQDVAFSPNGARLASASADTTVKIWDVPADHEALALRGHTNQLYGVAFHPQGGRLASASADRTVRIWDLATGDEAITLYGHLDIVYGVAFHPSGERLATASGDRTVRIWDTATGRETHVLRGHTGVVFHVAFSPDGRLLASASEDRTVRVWDAATGEARLTLRGHTAKIWTVAFSPDGNTLASAGDDRTIRLCDVATGNEKMVLSGHTAPVWAAVFSPDGQTLASAGDDQVVRLWDLAAGREMAQLSGHPTVLRSLTFSADGRRLAAGGGNQVRLWDIVTRQEVLVLQGSLTQIFCLAFSPDDLQLAASGNSIKHGDRAVMVWDGTPLTPERLEERQALGLVRMLLPTPECKDKALAILGAGPAQRDPVRQRALDLLEPCWQALVRRQAYEEVSSLFGKPLLRPEVLESLRANPGLSEPVRTEALALAERFVPSARALDSIARAAARPPDAGPGAYGLALRQAEAACELAPYEGTYRITRGIVLYRLQRYSEALDVLTQADRLLAAPDSPQPAALAFLAMTRHQLGQKEQVEAALLLLRKTMKKPEWTRNGECQAFWREAEALCAS